MKVETMVRTCLAALVVCLGTIPCLGDDSVAVGKPAPALVATGIDGKPVRLSEKLAGGEKNIVLMFSRANW